MHLGGFQLNVEVTEALTATQIVSLYPNPKPAGYPSYTFEGTDP